MKKDMRHVLDGFTRKCESFGLRVTPQRLTIYEELIKNTNHPTMRDVYKKVRKSIPHISFDTIYRTVMTFSEIGIIDLVEGYGTEKRFETQKDHHHHFRCVKCGKIVDIDQSEFRALKIPPSLSSKYTIINKRVHLEGICDECRKP